MCTNVSQAHALWFILCSCVKESPPLWWLVYSTKVWINLYIVSPGHTWIKIHLLCPYYQYIVVERRTRLPSKDDHVVVFRTCDCVVLCGKRTLQVRLNWGFWGGKIILDYLCSLTGYRRHADSSEEGERDREIWSWFTAGFGDGERGQGDQAASRNLEKARSRFSSRASGRNETFLIPYVSPVKSILDLWPLELEDKFKSLNIW